MSIAFSLRIDTHIILYNFLTFITYTQTISISLSIYTFTMAWSIHDCINTGKFASFREVLSDIDIDIDICFWFLYCTCSGVSCVYLGQSARNSPQCNQFCVNFIIWVHYRTGLFNFINFSPWMSTNKNERFVALNDIYGMHLKAQCYIYYARPKTKKNER